MKRNHCPNQRKESPLQVQRKRVRAMGMEYESQSVQNQHLYIGAHRRGDYEKSEQNRCDRPQCDPCSWTGTVCADQRNCGDYDGAQCRPLQCRLFQVLNRQRRGLLFWVNIRSGTRFGDLTAPCSDSRVHRLHHLHHHYDPHCNLEVQWRESPASWRRPHRPLWVRHRVDSQC